MWNSSVIRKPSTPTRSIARYRRKAKNLQTSALDSRLGWRDQATRMLEVARIFHLGGPLGRVYRGSTPGVLLSTGPLALYCSLLYSAQKLLDYEQIIIVNNPNAKKSTCKNILSIAFPRSFRYTFHISSLLFPSFPLRRCTSPSLRPYIRCPLPIAAHERPVGRRKSAELQLSSSRTGLRSELL